MTQKNKLGHDRDPGRDKILNTNYKFLGILGRPGHDPMRVMTQIFGLGHDPVGS
jgi:hypothetical protein